jgi:hypothetical protein
VKHSYNCIDALRAAGVSYDDAAALRRISMTLHRWHELECGDSNEYGAWCIVRGNYAKAPAGSLPRKRGEPRAFVHDDDGAPFMERHEYRWFRDADGKQVNKVTTHYTRLDDRERGALKRLAKIIARYPAFQAYVQGDPRGCALYILHPNAIAGAGAFSTDPAKRAEWLSCNYTRGIAVCK